jgi:predicted nucleotidyltransferase
MSEELAVLKETAQRLDRSGIAYMINGSTAANFYAVPRMTRDIDIVVELSERDVETFIDAFEKDHYLARIIRGVAVIKAKPFRSEGKAALP